MQTKFIEAVDTTNFNKNLDGVHEYCEGNIVQIVPWLDGDGKPFRLVVQATNEGGHNSTCVDLLELLSWVKKNMPEIWAKVDQG